MALPSPNPPRIPILPLLTHPVLHKEGCRVPWDFFLINSVERIHLGQANGAVWLLICFILQGEQQPATGRIISSGFDISVLEGESCLKPPGGSRQNPPSPVCSGTEIPKNPTVLKKARPEKQNATPKIRLF